MLASLGDSKRVQLLVYFVENLSILQNYNLPVSQWDFILINVLFELLVIGTATTFQESHGFALTLNNNSYTTIS